LKIISLLQSQIIYANYSLFYNIMLIILKKCLDFLLIKKWGAIALVLLIIQEIIRAKHIGKIWRKEVN
jgi:hypothetical protein